MFRSPVLFRSVSVDLDRETSTFSVKVKWLNEQPTQSCRLQTISRDSITNFTGTVEMAARTQRSWYSELIVCKKFGKNIHNFTDNCVFLNESDQKGRIEGTETGEVETNYEFILALDRSQGTFDEFYVVVKVYLDSSNTTPVEEFYTSELVPLVDHKRVMSNENLESDL